MEAQELTVSNNRSEKRMRIKTIYAFRAKNESQVFYEFFFASYDSMRKIAVSEKIEHDDF